MVGKFFEVPASVTRWIEVLPLRTGKDFINRFVQLRPETVCEIFRDSRVAAFDLACFFRCAWVEDVIHAAALMSTVTVEFFACQPTDGA